MQVLIRYNTDYPKKTNRKWRLIIEGSEILVDNISIRSGKAWTSEDEITRNGERVFKYHITVECQSIKFDDGDLGLLATLL